NLPIPDRPPGAASQFGQLTSTISVGGKKFKKTLVGAGSVQVTGLKTTGSAPGAASHLDFYLSAPNGRTVFLEASGLGGGPPTGIASLGPLTLTPDTKVQTCNATTPPCTNPLATLNRPFAGTAQDLGLETFEGLPATGNWTLTVQDTSN